MTTCWTATGDSYGYDGVAFTSAGNVWALDRPDLRRLSFPAMSNAATLETIDLTPLTSIQSVQVQNSVACAASDPIVCGVDVNGDAVVVNAATDTAIHNFGATALGETPVDVVYNPVGDKLYVANVNVPPAVDQTIYRMDTDGTNLQAVWSTSTEEISSHLLVASDGAVWWTTNDNVYRYDDGVAFDFLAEAAAGELTHDPEAPTRTLAYPPGFGAADLRFTFSAGSITSDTATCTDPGEIEAAAMSHDGTEGILVTTVTVKYWGGRNPWTVGRVQWGSRSGWH